MKIKTHLDLKIKTQQALVLTMAMQQALYVLQLPITDLIQWVRLQIEQNPLLQFDETPPEDYPTELDFDAQGFEVLDHLDETFVQGLFPDDSLEETSTLENLAKASVSLYDHLMEQARTSFNNPEQLSHAEAIIGNLDEKGFLGDFEADAQILAVIQTFDPPGIAARTLQESLLIQLSSLNKQNSLAYFLLSRHFDDLLRCRLSYLAKKLRMSVSELQASLQKEISSLDFHPASRFQQAPSVVVIPDIIIEQIESNLQIKINEAPLPRFTLSPPSMATLNSHYTEGKWMEKILSRRRDILTKIVQYLLVKHTGFFSGAAPNLTPLSMQEMAKELQLHESTVARAVKDKYVACPRGIFSLRYFFPHASSKQDDGTPISHIDSKQLLQQLILQEDKKKPLSDNALARAMSKAGIPCARRTVAKYRKVLNIPPASHRRNY
ncbi:MAG TPA: RNA polymerase factor sigma-54 [Rhabdochlamydiaceae bacterium]|jgi:RNA polymerase sigma-54 factor|nr:RNA polymerase factor sigma-54 [Rhabdochlamydiaceae bacterium]